MRTVSVESYWWQWPPQECPPIVVMVAAGVSFFVVVVALEVGAGSKACGQRLSQLFAKSIEVALGDCAFTQ